jgi:hypothetical protein
MTIFELSGKNLYEFEVYFVSDYNTDMYEFRAESEDQIMNFLFKECNILKTRNSNMSNLEIFESIKKTKKSGMFYFASGRYYYIKEIRKIIENKKEIKEKKVEINIKTRLKNICIIS